MHYEVTVFSECAEQLDQPTLSRGDTQEEIRLAQYSHRFSEAGEPDSPISEQAIRRYVNNHDVGITLCGVVNTQDYPLDIV
jgi:hypothetical protein